MMDLSTLENLMVQNNELLLRVYTTQLFAIGVLGAVGVCYLLYKCLRKFF